MEPLPRRAACVAFIALLVTLSSAGCDAPASSRRATPAPALEEGLVFSGDVSGLMSVGLNPQPSLSTRPRESSEPPSVTRCATFLVGEPSGNRDQVYEADIVGTVGGVRYGLYLEVEELAITPIPGSFNLAPGGFSPADAGLMSSDGNVATRWYRTAGMDLPSSFTVDAGARSGTINVSLAHGPYGSQVRITGSWRCG